MTEWSFTFDKLINKDTFLMFTILLLIAIAALLSERSGIINIALEGQLIAGVFGYTLFGYLTKNLETNKLVLYFLALLMAMICSGLLTLIFSLFVIKFKMNQILTAIALNIIMQNLAGFIIVSIKNNPQFVIDEDYLWLYKFENLRPYLILAITENYNFEMIYHVIFLAFIIFLVHGGLFWTRPGLHLRSCGESPRIALINGIKVKRYRFVSLIIGSAFIGIAATLFAELHVSFSGSVYGYGYLGLIMLILGARNLFLITAFTGLFVIIRTFISSIMDVTWKNLLSASNYLLPLLALTIYGFFWRNHYGKYAPPEALGR